MHETIGDNAQSPRAVESPHTLRAIAWLALAVVLGMVGAVAAFVAAAFAAGGSVSLIVAACTCFAIAVGLAWRHARRLFPAEGVVAPLAVGAGTVILASLLVALIFFRPMTPSAEPAVLPPGAEYWELPTGSRIAHLVIPAIGTKKPTPIIRVHGGPGGYAVANAPASAYFGQLAQDGYDVHFYDQIGSGLSARLDDPRDYTVTRSVADLEAIRQRIGAEQVILHDIRASDVALLSRCRTHHLRRAARALPRGCPRLAAGSAAASAARYGCPGLTLMTREWSWPRWSRHGSVATRR